jgi:hypothetical protein
MHRLSRILVTILGILGLLLAAAALSVQAGDEEAVRGGELFAGTRALANRGPACISCHDTTNAAQPVGGTPAPNLARAHARLGGTRGLRGWLAAPPAPVMRATFHLVPLQPTEVRRQRAYLERIAAGKTGPVPRARGAH